MKSRSQNEHFRHVATTDHLQLRPYCVPRTPRPFRPQSNGGNTKGDNHNFGLGLKQPPILAAYAAHCFKQLCQASKEVGK